MKTPKRKEPNVLLLEIVQVVSSLIPRHHHLKLNPSLASPQYTHQAPAAQPTAEGNMIVRLFFPFLR